MKHNCKLDKLKKPQYIPYTDRQTTDRRNTVPIVRSAKKMYSPNKLRRQAPANRLAVLSVAPRPSVCMSVSPSVLPVPPIFSNQESRKNFEFTGKIALDKSNYGSKFEVQRSRSLGTKTEKYISTSR